MIDCLALLMSAEGLRRVSQPHVNALNRVLDILNETARVRGCTAAVPQLFDKTKLSIMCDSAKRSDNFVALQYAVKATWPDVFQDLLNASQSVRLLLSQAI